jgi:hypothetical protein
MANRFGIGAMKRSKRGGSRECALGFYCLKCRMGVKRHQLQVKRWCRAFGRVGFELHTRRRVHDQILGAFLKRNSLAMRKQLKLCLSSPERFAGTRS